MDNDRGFIAQAGRQTFRSYNWRKYETGSQWYWNIFNYLLFEKKGFLKKDYWPFQRAIDTPTTIIQILSDIIISYSAGEKAEIEHIVSNVIGKTNPLIQNENVFFRMGGIWIVIYRPDPDIDPKWVIVINQ